MDPAGAELQAINSVDAAVTWIGMAAPVLTALRGALGDFQLLRELVLMPATAWDLGVAAARVQDPQGDAEQPPPGRALRALELGQVASLRRIARLRLGLTPTDEGAAAQPAAAPAAGAEAAAGARTLESGGRRRLKMSSIFDQADDSEIWAWGPGRHGEVLAAFRAVNDGEEPHPDEEATMEQLATLEHRLAQGGCPAPDFGVWRPYGHRLARQLKLVVHHVTPGGDYLPHEVPGPPSYSDWLLAFRVFSMAMRALGAATQTRLLMYQHRVERFNSDYGQVCWWLVAQADQRLRGEHLGRIRRREEAARRAAVQ